MNKYYFKYFLIFIISFCSCSPAGRIQRAQKAEIRHLLKEKISTDKYSSYSFENMAVEIEGLINIKGNGKLYIKRNEFIF